MPQRRASVGITLILLMAAATAFGQSAITLAWDPSSDSRIVGYRLYEGVMSGSYSNVLDVGNVTTATVSNLVWGGTYYFALSAYDINGQDSPLSTEISYTVPFPTHPRLGVSVTPGSGAPVVLNLMGPPGQTCIILGSDDLRTWTAIGTAQFGANGEVQFTDPASIAQPSRSYRLQIANPTIGISLTPGSGAPIVLNLMGPPGQTCIILGSDDLRTWTAIGTAQFGANGEVQFTDPASIAQPSRSYRLQIANPTIGISLTPGSGAPIVLNLMGPPGQTCIIQGSDDLNTWTAIGTAQFDANGRAQFTDRDSTILPSRFYRVRIGMGSST